MAMRKLIVGENDFQTCAPNLMKEWNWNKNEILPDSFHIGQNKRVWWICSTCGHEWEALTQNRLPGPRKGNGCPKCAEKKRLETHMRKMEQSSENLATVFPEVAAEWHPTKSLTSPYTPYNVSAKSQHKVWWLGKCGHVWDYIAREYYKIIKSRPDSNEVIEKPFAIKKTDGTAVAFENGKDGQVLITRSNRPGETVIMSADMICRCLGI